MDFGIGARKQLPLRIVDIHFYVQRPGGRVNRSRSAYQLTLESSTWKLRKRKICREPRSRCLRVNLWHANEDPQVIDCRDLKQRACLSTSGARINELPDIRVAGCNDAIEWCVDLLEGDQLFESVYVCLCRLY